MEGEIRSLASCGFSPRHKSYIGCMRHHSDHLSAPRTRKRPKGSKSQSLLRDMHAPVGVIESRGHLRGGEINRKVLAMAYIPEKHKRYGLLPLSAEAMFDAQSREPEGQGNAIQDRG